MKSFVQIVDMDESFLPPLKPDDVFLVETEDRGTPVIFGPFETRSEAQGGCDDLALSPNFENTFLVRAEKYNPS